MFIDYSVKTARCLYDQEKVPRHAFSAGTNNLFFVC